MCEVLERSLFVYCVGVCITYYLVLPCTMYCFLSVVFGCGNLKVEQVYFSHNLYHYKYYLSWDLKYVNRSKDPD